MPSKTLAGFSVIADMYICAKRREYNNRVHCWVPNCPWCQNTDRTQDDGESLGT